MLCKAHSYVPLWVVEIPERVQGAQVHDSSDGQPASCAAHNHGSALIAPRWYSRFLQLEQFYCDFRLDLYFGAASALKNNRMMLLLFNSAAFECQDR